MNHRIQEHIDGLFYNKPNTTKINELKEEILINLNEKYDDLIKKGLNENNAFKEVIAGLGNINELIESISLEEKLHKNINTKKYKSRSRVVTLSIILYLISFFIFAFPDLLYIDDKNSLPAALLLTVIATAAIVYAKIMLPKDNDNLTVAENIIRKAAKSEQSKQILHSVISILWVVTPLLYFLYSFKSSRWHTSWLIFLIAVIFQMIIQIIFDYFNISDRIKLYRHLRGYFSTILWVGTVIIYLLFSFRYGRWHISWLIYPAAVIAEMIIQIICDLVTVPDKNKLHKNLRGYCSAILWVGTVILYFLISFRYQNWHISWAIFLMSVVVENMIGIIFAGIKKG